MKTLIGVASFHEVWFVVMESEHSMSRSNEHRHSVATQNNVKAVAGMTANGADEGRTKTKKRERQTKRERERERERKRRQ